MNKIETVELAPGYTVPRIINGGWQMQGQTPEDVKALLSSQADAGLIAFETSDTYPEGENLLGAFQALRRRNNEAPVRIHTRYSPDVASGPPSSKEVVNIVDAALLRLRSDQIDLLQLQWWQLETEGWLDVYGWLCELQQVGKIGHVGLSNFNLPSLQTILEAGLPVVSNQVQISLVDQRALGDMRDLCMTNNISLLGYGPLTGGFLTSNKADPASISPPVDYSREYRLMVDLFGGWDLLQDLVSALTLIGERHDTVPGVIALRWLLDQSGVSALLLGASNPRNIARNLKVFELQLTAPDNAELSQVLAHRQPSQGGPGELERDPNGHFQKLIADSREEQQTG
jgi:aryl-alcohol dehydrogenase-like predicted oxidoreductase